ncbi:MAG: M28 family peptidase, partial [Bacteroidia bacterium]|nr:M28 family peptidase [Bacteroidia bacterium]
YYTKNPTLDTSTFTYMINMDMVGRLDTIKHSFVISGTGTSPIWNTTLKNVPSNLKVKFDESGTGASDHTSFYYINIPALHFFTGSHFDYHKPSDDADKINYKGTVQIIDYIYNLVGSLDNSGKLKFTPTAQDTTAKVRFKVTLGVMPDYLYDGKGLKVDGVTTGKPAQIAGVKRGDLIIKLGDTIVQDMQSYMKSLSQFNKGDETKVVVVRDGKELELPIKF